MQHSHTSRLLWVDAIRSIAIFLVVLNHSLGFSSVSSSITTITTQTFFQALVRIAVPLFVLLSGALLLTKKESSYEFYKKRLVKLLLPWLFWTMLYFFWYLWTQERTYYSLYSFAKEFYVIFMSQFWFLPMLTGLYILTPLLRRMVQNTPPLIIWGGISCWVVLFSILPLVNAFLPLSFHNSQYYILEHLGYFLLGYLLMNTKRAFSPLHLFLIFFLSITAQMIGLLLQQLPTISQQAYLNYNTSPFIILTSLTLFIFVKLYFQTKHISWWGREGVIQIARISFGIFLTHDLIRMILTRGVGERSMYFPLPYPFAVLLQTLIIFLVSGILIFLLRKTTLGKYLAT